MLPAVLNQYTTRQNELGNTYSGTIPSGRLLAILLAAFTIGQAERKITLRIWISEPGGDCVITLTTMDGVNL